VINLKKLTRYSKCVATLLIILFLAQMASLPTTVKTSSKPNESTVTVSNIPSKQAVDKPSIDAIAVWVRRESSTSENYEIWYSMYGHEPSIPARNEQLTWKWWNGTDPDIPASPLFIHDKNSHPDVAFGRAGGIIVVWSYIGGPEGPFRIMYAKWDSNTHSWSIGTLPEHGLPSPKVLTGLQCPTIAIDVNGKAIAAWQANWYYSTETEYYSGTDLYYSTWDGTTWSEPICLYDAPLVTDNDYSASEPELTFTTHESNATSPLTRHKAILVWTYTHVDSATGTYEGEIRYAIWDGSSFSAQDTVPGSYSTTYSVGAADLSSDKLGNTKVVWGLNGLVYSAKWNGSDWTTTSVCTHTDAVHRARIAFNESNGGIMVHDVATEGIYYNLEENGNWSTCTYIAQGDYPSVAYLAHNLTLACWINTTVKFSVFNGTAWSSPSEIPDVTGYYIGEVAVAAKTGSPTLPLAEWTFFAYQQADNDLEEAIAENNLNEIKSIGSTALINVVTLTDRNSTTVTNLYYVRENEVVERTVEGWIPAELNLADDETLEMFIKWTMEEYPAGHYILVLDNHGGGYKGSMSERDNINGTWRTLDILTLDELDSALSDAGLQSQKLDIIGFDACLMAMLEVAYVVKDYAEYLVASEQPIPLDSWPYGWILSDLTDNPLMTKRELVETIIDNYRLYYDNRPRMYPETLAGIDLSQIDNLVNALDALVFELLANLDTYETEIINARLNTQEAYLRPEYIDLYSFANQIHNRITDADIRDCAMNVMTNISAIVINWNDISPQAGEPWTRSDFHGLTIYFEKIQHAYDGRYNDTSFARNTLWDDFVCAYLTPAILRTNIMIVRLQSLLPLYLHVYDSSGNHIGYNASLKPPIEVGIPNASYVELGNNTILIYFPAEVKNFTWVVDAGILTEEEYETNYTLTITVLSKGEMIFEEVHSGTILYNTTLSGEFKTLYQLNVYVYGSVIENATVEVYFSDGTLAQTGKTNATGCVTFFLHEGEYYVKVNASGYKIATTEVFYLNGTKTIKIKLAPERPILTIILCAGVATVAIIGLLIVVFKGRERCKLQ